MASSERSIHEIDFCSQVATATKLLIDSKPSEFVFGDARVEGAGAGSSRRKRKDLRFYDRTMKLLLCGEVKMPGTPEGRSPYDSRLCKDAADKAEATHLQYFFTWNVNTFVLWDRSLWQRALEDRRVWERRLGRNLQTREDVAREDNLNYIKKDFLPDLLRDLSDILSGRKREWFLPPDDVFIRSLESHLDWPVSLLSAFILERADHNRAFSRRIEQWMTDQDRTFVRNRPEEWMKSVDNMAKTLAYVWINRLIFYKALCGRFVDLPRLQLPPQVKTPELAVAGFNRLFQRAVDRSGDYEPLLMPDASDWATALVFQPTDALDAWRGLLRNLEPVDFSTIPSDIVGRIFQKLIGPAERHRYGQHFTGDDVVDVINVFCVRDSTARVLDPACGSGSFLVRAYYRKRELEPRRSHLDLIADLFGCDIALYPAHLATLNLAAREINEEANYPRIVRRDFFSVDAAKPFCKIPNENGEPDPILLPELDAVVGNPPYVRQEKIGKDHKHSYAQVATAGWPGLALSGRSDLHCYFWPAASRLLKRDGYFGFLTSSSWLDVEYGFALQAWVLSNFRVVAVMESAAEPWFEDARVKTCVTILKRCDSKDERMGNKVRFVRFARRLADLIGVPAGDGDSESHRQEALDGLRRRILGAEETQDDGDLRIIVKDQVDLWNDGLRAGVILGEIDVEEGADELEDAEVPEILGSRQTASRVGMFRAESGSYRAGKWGRYVRAPGFYFEVMQRFRDRFVPLGEIATIRRGITSGCDAFFMPKDVTAELLEQHESDKDFRRHAGGAPRHDVESGNLRIIQSGDGSVHPIEARFLQPEVHSLMKVDRPIVHAADLDRVVLLVGEPLERLKTKYPWVHRYLRYGMTQSFASSKSKPIPVPKRSTCAARDPWYDLTKLVRPGAAFWPMAQQYRHVVAANPERLICNHNLFDIAGDELSEVEAGSLVAILNSTLVALFKTFYGRFAGTEGNLKTEVVDVHLLEVPDPRSLSKRVSSRLGGALDCLMERSTGRLVEEQLMDCHSPDRARRIAAGPLVLAQELQQPDRRALDDAVFEVLGVSNPEQRTSLINRLYEATARHFRDIRVVEIEKMEQRSKSDSSRFTIDDLAADIWDAADLEDTTPLADWLRDLPGVNSTVEIPEEWPAAVMESPLFEETAVYFGKARKARVECASQAQAELVARVANLGLTGAIRVPSGSKQCLTVLGCVNDRVAKATARLRELAESRTGDARIQDQLLEVLLSWFVRGRDAHRASVTRGSEDKA